MASHTTLPTIITTEDGSEGGMTASSSANADEISVVPAASIHERSTSNGSVATSPMGHSRNTSLQVPGSAIPENNEAPSSPTLSATSDFSEGGLPGYPTALALRDNDPNHRLAHARQPSFASVITSGTTGVKPHATSMSNHESGDTPVTTAGSQYDSKDSTSKRVGENEKSAVSKDAEEEIEKNASGWKRFKANLKGHTRSGRKAAQASALEAERMRLLNIDPTPFPLKPTDLADLVDPKSVSRLRELGGVDAVLAGLGTDGTKGLDAAGQEHNDKRPEGWVSATSEDRERVYGKNVLPEKKSKSLLLLMWLALQDRILILLIIAAIVSLALGLYTDFGAEPERIPCENPPPGQEECALPSVDWVEGLAILIAVAIVDMVGSLNDWQKERQFKVLNAKKEERDVKVLRNGDPMLISVHDLRVGDICQIEPGEIIPCDGIFLRGHNVKVDESSATGESDMIRKLPYEECLQDLEQAEAKGVKPPNRDCFLISGSRCLEGAGDYCVIAVGPISFNGKLLMSLRTDSEMTPLQAKLNRLAEIIAYAGTAAGVLLFIALMIRFFIQLARPQFNTPNTPSDKAGRFIDILIAAVVIIVVAVPEGLPLATTLALAFATKRMTKENLLVRMLSACETSANVSVICTDKTGTLTQNEMTVVAGSLGVYLKFALDLEDNQGRVERKEKTLRPDDDWSVDQRKLGTVVDGPVRQLFNDAITVNSTAFEEADVAEMVANKKEDKTILGKFKAIFAKKEKAAAPKNPKANNFVGSKTETALLKMAKDLQWEDYKSARARSEIVTNFPFSSERKAMAVVVKRADGGYRLFVKGASEILTRLCNKHIDVDRNSPDAEITTSQLSTEAEANVAKTIMFYANQSLRTIALCYRDFESWPPKDSEMDVDGLVTYESLAKEMTLIAITAIEDPLRPGVREAVATCGKAGVQIKMVTGDNVVTARSIATQCGIFTPGGIIMEGPVFRKLSESDMMAVVPRLQVMARCSPEDKKRLVECLKKLDSIVAVTGDGTNDSPALKTANVGFSMGIAGTEVAREASDIILMDDNFQSIVTAIQWGRSVNDAVKRFLTFQLSVNIGAVGITFISAVASSEEKAVFTAVQLLWINLIMDTLAALALATDPASPELLNRKPGRIDDPLISTDMWKMIVGQAAYQFIFILILNFQGIRILGLDGPNEILDIRGENLLRALIFNAYVFCQLFNQVNCRSLNRELNFFKGLHKNAWFMAIIIIEVAFQVLIAFKGGAAFSVVPMGGREWGITIIGGLLSWPIGALIRLVPTQPIENALIRIGLMPDPNALPRHKAREFDPKAADKLKSEWEEPAIGELADELHAFARIRGGRSRVAFIGKSRSRRMHDADIHPGGLLALVPALIAGGIGGNWRPRNPPEASISNPNAGDPSVSTWNLYQGGEIQFHPETKKSDTFLEELESGVTHKQK